MSIPYAGYWEGARARWFGPETNYGEFEGGTEIWNPFGRNVRYTPAANLNPEDIPDLGYQHPVAIEKKQEEYNFTITFWVQDLTLLPFVVGDGTNYTLEDAIASFHVQVVFSPPDATGSDLYHTYYGCKIDSMDLKVAFGNKLECTLNIVAKTLVADFTADPAVAWTDETAQSGIVSQFEHFTVYIDPGGAEAEEPNISEINVSLKNNLERIGCVSGSTIRGLVAKRKDYGGTLTEIFEDNVQVGRFIAQTPLTTVRIHCTNFGAGHKNMWFHNVKLLGEVNPLSPGEISTTSLPFRATETVTQKPVTFS